MKLKITERDFQGIEGGKMTRGEEKVWKKTGLCLGDMRKGQYLCIELTNSIGDAGEMPWHPRPTHWS